jgi:transposase InsO family protein
MTMRGTYAATKQSYGRPRMYAELRDDGVLANHQRVGRLVKLDGLVGITRRRKMVHDDAGPKCAPGAGPGAA